MALIRKIAGLGTAFAVAAVLFGAFAASANAQTPPFTAYGTGLTAGAVVGAWIGDTACGEATVDADGNWLIYVEAGGDCAPVDGDEIAFTIDAAATNETAVYSAGGAPADVANGISLTLAEAEEPAPEPAETGSAGLLGSTGTSMALVLALGVFAAAMVAGGRTATRRS
jgi:hypothetical protein